MSSDLEVRLATLRQDFAAVAGRPFEHFFCPLLLVDENTALCRAHVVNRAVADSSRRWTVQRKDVDNFFGAMFEGEFTTLQLDRRGVALRAFVDVDLNRRLRPRIIVDGVPVEHFVIDGPVPANFSEMSIQHGSDEIKIALKMNPEQVALLAASGDWHVEVSRDLRVQSVVSLLKGAHLSLFDVLGYGYVLAPNGVWLARVLGSFYLQNAKRQKREVLLAAAKHFAHVAAMVRPVDAAPPAITGTVDDRWFYFCWLDDGGRAPWGLVTHIRTGERLHAVLTPTFADESCTARFAEFLAGGVDSFEVSLARFDTTQWSLAPDRQRVIWPKAGLQD